MRSETVDRMKCRCMQFFVCAFHHLRDLLFIYIFFLCCDLVASISKHIMTGNNFIENHVRKFLKSELSFWLILMWTKKIWRRIMTKEKKLGRSFALLSYYLDLWYFPCRFSNLHILMLYSNQNECVRVPRRENSRSEKVAKSIKWKYSAKRYGVPKSENFNHSCTSFRLLFLHRFILCSHKGSAYD